MTIGSKLSFFLWLIDLQFYILCFSLSNYFWCSDATNFSCLFFWILSFSIVLEYSKHCGTLLLMFDLTFFLSSKFENSLLTWSFGLEFNSTLLFLLIIYFLLYDLYFLFSSSYDFSFYRLTVKCLFMFFEYCLGHYIIFQILWHRITHMSLHFSLFTNLITISII